MPTPESAAFLAKKPTVPPTYDGVDFDDNIALHNARDAIIREQWVRSMMSRLVGEELGKCYMREGVNHFEKCGRLRGELDVCLSACCRVLARVTWADWVCWVDGWLILAERYLELLSERKIKGYLGMEKNYWPERGEKPAN